MNPLFFVRDVSSESAVATTVSLQEPTWVPVDVSFLPSDPSHHLRSSGSFSSSSLSSFPDHEPCLSTSFSSSSSFVATENPLFSSPPPALPFPRTSGAQSPPKQIISTHPHTHHNGLNVMTSLPARSSPCTTLPQQSCCDSIDGHCNCAGSSLLTNPPPLSALSADTLMAHSSDTALLWRDDTFLPFT